MVLLLCSVVERFVGYRYPYQGTRRGRSLYVPLYVDDLAMYYSSGHMPSIERKLQHSLNRLGRWCDENDF